MNKNSAALLELVICASLWSIAGIFIKMIPWHPFVIAGFRSLIASLVVLVYIKIRKYKVVITKNVLLSAVLLCLTFFAFVVANKLTTAANAIVLQFTAPVFIMVYSVILFKQRFLKRDILTVIITMAGMALFFLDELNIGMLLGNIVAIASGAFMAGMYIAVGRTPDSERMSGVFFGHILTAVIGIPFMFFSSTHFTSVAIINILILGIFQLGIPYILFGLASGHCSPLACSLVGAIEPLLNPVWVMIFNGEAPGVYALYGGIIVISCITTWCVLNRGESSQ